jgi:hypothetical protein
LEVWPERTAHQWWDSRQPARNLGESEDTTTRQTSGPKKAGQCRQVRPWNYGFSYSKHILKKRVHSCKPGLPPQLHSTSYSNSGPRGFGGLCGPARLYFRKGSSLACGIVINFSNAFFFSYIITLHKFFTWQVSRRVFLHAVYLQYCIWRSVFFFKFNESCLRCRAESACYNLSLNAIASAVSPNASKSGD